MPKEDAVTVLRDAPQTIDAFRDRLLGLKGQLPQPALMSIMDADSFPWSIGPA